MGYTKHRNSEGKATLSDRKGNSIALEIPELPLNQLPGISAPYFSAGWGKTCCFPTSTGSWSSNFKRRQKSRQCPAVITQWTSPTQADEDQHLSSENRDVTKTTQPNSRALWGPPCYEKFAWRAWSEANGADFSQFCLYKYIQTWPLWGLLTFTAQRFSKLHRSFFHWDIPSSARKFAVPTLVGENRQEKDRAHLNTQKEIPT